MRSSEGKQPRHDRGYETRLLPVSLISTREREMEKEEEDEESRRNTAKILMMKFAGCPFIESLRN